MKKSLFQKVMCTILSVTMLLGAFAVTAYAGELKPDSSASTLEEMQSITGANSYGEYILDYLSESSGPATIVLDNSTALSETIAYVKDSAACITAIQKDQSAWANFGNENMDTSLYLPATGSATWTFTVPDDAAGLYYIKITYFNCNTYESSISEIERKLYIDDKLPFSEAGSLSLSKTWKYDNSTVEVTTVSEPDSYNIEYKQITKGTDEDGYYKIITEVKSGTKTVTTYKISQDINGNSMAPDSVQISLWNDYYCEDASGYYSGYFMFYVLNGTRTLTLEAELSL